MNPQPPTRNALHFGAKYLVTALKERIDAHFDNPMPDEPALVVGLFGAWGSGKSRILKEVGNGFRRNDELATLAEKPDEFFKAIETSLVVPVTFNAWRFEREAHLIVPLLKVTEFALREFQESFEAASSLAHANTGEPFDKAWRGKVAAKLGKGLKFFATAALSMAAGLSVKANIPGLFDVEFSGEKTMKMAEEQTKAQKNADDAKTQAATAQLDFQSLYYEFEQRLQAITGNTKDGPPLRLLFLVDDLDRCLPEKAVEMLEAIKLFLDVAGCAFVIALDDIVVDRGIAHRYRDYAPERNAHGDSIAHSMNPDAYREFAARRGERLHSPITGYEYLEKIIQLPFRIARPSEAQCREFLLERYSYIFREVKAENADPSDLRSAPLGDYTQAENNNRLMLLDLFVQTISPVPRKLVRAIEQYLLLRDIAKLRALTLDSLLLARCVILQLFAPELYRQIRLKPGVFTALVKWAKEDRLQHPADLMLQLQQENRKLNDATKPATDEMKEKTAEPPSTQDKLRHFNLDTLEIPAATAVAELLAQRDPIKLNTLLKDQDRHGEIDPGWLRQHVELWRDGEETQPSLPITVASQQGKINELRHNNAVEMVATATGEKAAIDLFFCANLNDAPAFILQLCSDDPKDWKNALDQERERLLPGYVLHDEDFQKLLTAKTLAGFSNFPAWLALLEPHMPLEQVVKLVNASTILNDPPDDAIHAP